MSKRVGRVYAVLLAALIAGAVTASADTKIIHLAWDDTVGVASGAGAYNERETAYVDIRGLRGVRIWGYGKGQTANATARIRVEASPDESVYTWLLPVADSTTTTTSSITFTQNVRSFHQYTLYNVPESTGTTMLETNLLLMPYLKLTLMNTHATSPIYDLNFWVIGEQD